MQTTGSDQQKIFLNIIFYFSCLLDVLLIIECYSSMVYDTSSYKLPSRQTNQQSLLEKQIDQIGVKYMEELEDIRTELEVRQAENFRAGEHKDLKQSLVLQLTSIASKLEKDILDYSQEFENNKLKKILTLLKVFKDNNKKLASFNLEKYGGKTFDKFAMKKVDIILEILDDMISDQA